MSLHMANTSIISQESRERLLTNVKRYDSTRRIGSTSLVGFPAGTTIYIDPAVDAEGLAEMYEAHGSFDRRDGTKHEYDYPAVLAKVNGVDELLNVNRLLRFTWALNPEDIKSASSLCKSIMEAEDKRVGAVMARFAGKTITFGKTKPVIIHIKEYDTDKVAKKLFYPPILEE